MGLPRGSSVFNIFITVTSHLWQTIYMNQFEKNVPWGRLTEYYTNSKLNTRSSGQLIEYDSHSTCTSVWDNRQKNESPLTTVVKKRHPNNDEAIIVRYLSYGALRPICEFPKQLTKTVYHSNVHAHNHYHTRTNYPLLINLPITRRLV